MLIAIPAENDPAEGRVAATPETVKKFVGLGAEVKIQTGAGLKSGIPDQEYTLAGAAIAPDALATVKDADIVLRVRRPSAADIAGAKQGAAVVAIMDPYGHIDALNSLAAADVCAFAMELMPRITRAQTMDVLSSQANIAGYRAVIDAAVEYGRVIPMMMTAAGMIPPAKIFIMGVGVAGLQAIATARKLGAIVTATDVRPATKEQVVSLGAKFIAVEDEEFKQAETAAGYAKEMSAGYKAKQAALTASHIAVAGYRRHDGPYSRPPGAGPCHGPHGRIDASRLGYRRSCRRTRWKLRIGETRRDRRCKKWRQDRRPFECRRTAARHGLGALCEKPSGFRRDPDRPENQVARDQVGR